MYYIARIVDGNWQVLYSATTHVDAAMMLGMYCDMYPDARLGIVSNTHYEGR